MIRPKLKVSKLGAFPLSLEGPDYIADPFGAFPEKDQSGKSRKDLENPRKSGKSQKGPKRMQKGKDETRSGNPPVPFSGP